jgi:peptidyl-prolyl cis-trans isomerase D
VAEIIRQKLVEDKAAEFAASVGQAFAARVAAGEEAVVVAEDMGFTWVLYEDLERNSADVDAEVLSKVFSMKLDGSVASSVLGFGSNSGDFNVVQLMAVKPGDATSLTEQEAWSVSKVLSESLGGVDYRSYRSVVQRKATIEKI